MGNQNRPSLSLKGKPRLYIKGRIFLVNVTHIVVSTGPGIGELLRTILRRF